MRYISPLVSAARGTVGGFTAVQGAAAPFIRARVAPAKSKTAPQQLRRAQQSAIAAGWKTLTQAQRDAWNRWGAARVVQNALGVSTRLSGFAWYVSCNRNLQLLNLTAVTAAPVAMPIFANFNGTVVMFATSGGNPTAYRITLPTLLNPTYVHTLISSTGGLSHGLTTITPQMFRYLPPPYSFNSTDYNPGAAWLKVFPSAPIHSQYGTRLQLIDPATGLSSPPWQTTTIVP